MQDTQVQDLDAQWVQGGEGMHHYYAGETGATFRPGKDQPGVPHGQEGSLTICMAAGASTRGCVHNRKMLMSSL